MASKLCRTCGVDKDHSEFHIARRNSDGLFHHCKDCRSEHAARYYVNNKENFARRQRAEDPAHRRDLRLRRQYGITSEQYEQMFAHQGGVCAVCARPPKNQPLNVDHDHKTGLVRGLLCWRCNSRVVGAALDDATLLRNAADYLDNPPACSSIGAVYGRTGRVTKRRRRKTTKRKEI